MFSGENTVILVYFSAFTFTGRVDCALRWSPKLCYHKYYNFSLSGLWEIQRFLVSENKAAIAGLNNSTRVVVSSRWRILSKFSGVLRSLPPSLGSPYSSAMFILLMQEFTSILIPSFLSLVYCGTLSYYVCFPSSLGLNLFKWEESRHFREYCKLTRVFWNSAFIYLLEAERSIFL